ncbi:hypothetical protein CEXT_606921 [Caerostris extrusa]|uniref:Uncharacterized protein n=1 Tax=Caerostris extrusa TaxID=172846 RepID=A0AAV4NJE7_CAEEX|nr:hypothetical protein CEXT_606921 [Caerostris extrusa]
MALILSIMEEDDDDEPWSPSFRPTLKKKLFEPTITKYVIDKKNPFRVSDANILQQIENVLRSLEDRYANMASKKTCSNCNKSVGFESLFHLPQDDSIALGFLGGGMHYLGYGLFGVFHQVLENHKQKQNLKNLLMVYKQSSAKAKYKFRSDLHKILQELEFLTVEETRCRVRASNPMIVDQKLRAKKDKILDRFIEDMTLQLAINLSNCVDKFLTTTHDTGSQLITGNSDARLKVLLRLLKKEAGSSKTSIIKTGLESKEMESLTWYPLEESADAGLETKEVKPSTEEVVELIDVEHPVRSVEPGNVKIAATSDQPESLGVQLASL